MDNYNAWVEINLDNLSKNIKSLKQRIGSAVKIMAVIKANAYGHGATEIAQTALENGADSLGVASCYEGRALRLAGIKERIFITNAIMPEDVSSILEWDLTPFVYAKDFIEILNKESAKAGKRTSVHVKIDTGMGRLGLAPENFLDFMTALNCHKNLKAEGVLTHFASADKDENFTRTQIDIFNKALKKARENGFDFNLIHAANSAALIKNPESHFNLVRPGLSIYGLYPDFDLKDKIDLKPVMEIKSKITFIKHVPKGTSISYGRTFITSHPGIIATIPVGYGDGYSRLLSNKGQVLLQGKRANIVGRVCMDNFMIDVTDFPEVHTGAVVTLLGRDGKDIIDADELAEKTGTINYEVVCRVASRLPRVYIQHGKIKKVAYI